MQAQALYQDGALQREPRLLLVQRMGSRKIANMREVGRRGGEGRRGHGFNSDG